MSARKSSRNLLGVLALLLAGCASLPARPPEPLAPELHRLLDGMDRRWRQFEDLRTRVEISLRRGSQVQRLSGVLLLKSPDSIRLELLSPWGQPLLLLAATKDALTLYQVIENRALVGPASARATERWLGFALEPTELVAILAGRVLPMKEVQNGALRPRDGLGPSLELVGAGGVQRIWLDPETLVVHQVEWTGGSTLLRITYDGADAVDPPAALTLEALDRPLSVSIRYREPEVGVGLPPEAFALTLPEDAKIQRLR